MSLYLPGRGRRRVVEKFTTSQGMVALLAVTLAMVFLLWLFASGYLRVDLD